MTYGDPDDTHRIRAANAKILRDRLAEQRADTERHLIEMEADAKLTDGLIRKLAAGHHDFTAAETARIDQAHGKRPAGSYRDGVAW